MFAEHCDPTFRPQFAATLLDNEMEMSVMSPANIFAQSPLPKTEENGVGHESEYFSVDAATSPFHPSIFSEPSSPYPGPTNHRNVTGLSDAAPNSRQLRANKPSEEALHNTKKWPAHSLAQRPRDGESFTMSRCACTLNNVSRASLSYCSKHPAPGTSRPAQNGIRELQRIPGISARQGQRSHAGPKSSHAGSPNASQHSKSGSKRKREFRDEGNRSVDNGHGSDDHNEHDDNDASDVSARPTSRLLACHFHKRDPLKFRGPGKFKACQNGFLGFNRLKQHLRTVHQPKSYCMGCESIFDSQDEKDNHDRTHGECERRRTERRTNQFDEMITNDRQREALKRKLVSVSTSTHWFDMWKCLNGDLPRPASPYKETSLDAADFVQFVKQRTMTYAQEFASQVNPGVLSVQSLTAFGHSLLEKAAAEYLQQNAISPPVPTPQVLPVGNVSDQGEAVEHQIHIPDPLMGQQSPSMEMLPISPGLLSNMPPPTIVVADKEGYSDWYNFNMSEGGAAYFTTEDPMLGTINMAHGVQWITPTQDPTLYHGN